jgi:hypothetical protein
MGSSVISSSGGAADAVYPPKDYAITRSYFTRLTAIERGSVVLTTSQGSSSRDNLPLFLIQAQFNRQGLFGAIGSTGDWKLTIQLSSKDKTLNGALLSTCAVYGQR